MTVISSCAGIGIIFLIGTVLDLTKLLTIVETFER